MTHLRRDIAAVAAFFRRDRLILGTYRLRMALQLVAAVVSLVMFYALSDYVNLGDDAADFDGDYFSYVLIGVTVVTMFETFVGSFTGRIREEQVVGTLEAVLSTPVSFRAVVLGVIALDAVLTLLSAAVTIVAGVVLFGADLSLTVAGVAVVLAALLAVVTICGALGVLIAAIGVVYKDPGPLVGFVTVGLALTASVYFPTAALPGVIGAVADLSPLTWAVDELRQALLGGDPSLVRAFGAMAIGLGLFAGALGVFRRSVEIAAKRGTIAHY